MLNFDVSLPIIYLLAMIAGGIFIGYFFRRQEIRKKLYKISELRKEIVYNHSYILELQKEYVSLEATMNGTIAPVLPMKKSLHEIKKTADAALR